MQLRNLFHENSLIIYDNEFEIMLIQLLFEKICEFETTHKVTKVKYQWNENGLYVFFLNSLIDFEN